MVASLLFVIAGLLFILGLSRVVPDSAHSTVFEIGAVLLSIGLISFGYEFYLRQTVTREMLDAVGLAHDLKRVGIRSIGIESELRWASLLENGMEYRFLFIDPTTWVSQEWARVLAAARRRQVVVRVYLPDPGGPSLAAIADRIGLESDALRQRIAGAATELESGWKDARDSGRPLIAGSSMEIRYYLGVPGFAIAAIDENVVLMLSPSLNRAAADQSLACSFERGETALVRDWIASQFARLDELPQVYAG